MHYFDSNLPKFKYLFVKKSNEVRKGFLFTFNDNLDSISMESINKKAGYYCPSYYCISEKDKQKILSLFNTEQVIIEMTFENTEDKFWYLYENKNGVLHFKAKDERNKLDMYVSIDSNDEIIWSLNHIYSLDKSLNFRFTKTAKETIIKLLNKESDCNMTDIIEEIKFIADEPVIETHRLLKIGCQEWSYQTWLNDYKSIAAEHGIKLNDHFNKRFELWLREQHFKQARTIDFMGKPHKMIVVNGVKELVEFSKPIGKALWSEHKLHVKKGDVYTLELEYDGEKLVELGSGKQMNPPNDALVTPVNQ